MTVGIALTNGVEAVVITDTRVTMGGRHTDYAQKLGSFSNDDYNGVVFGAGLANVVLSVTNSQAGPSGSTLKSLDDYVKEIHGRIRSVIDATDEAELANLMNEARKKAAVFDSEADKNAFLQQQRGMALQQYDQFKQQNRTALATVAFDKHAGKVRMHYIYDAQPQELHTPELQIGSGVDGAQLYFTTFLQGVNRNSLAVHQLLFNSMNAYCVATVNEGVGGTPTVAVVSSGKTNILQSEQTRALINLTGAYLSRYLSIAPEKAIEHVKDILESPEPDYERLADSLQVNQTALTGTAIPFSVWQERANERIFGNSATMRQNGGGLK